MEQGTFLFIKDDFFTKHDPNGSLMKNKEGGHNRPCFYAFPDKKQPDIFWCVPISSQIEKFERIVQRKISKQIARGYKTPKCNTIRFGNVLGQKRAFLIQNMFPVTSAYVSSIYMDRNTHKPVTISQRTEKDITQNAKDILRLVFRGYNIIFSDVQKIYKDLIAELHPEQQKKSEIHSMRSRFATAQTEAARRNNARDIEQPRVLGKDSKINK